VAPSTTAAAEPRIATPSAREVSPASTTCVRLVPTVSRSPARHWAAEPTAAPSATAAEEFLTVRRPARMATSAARRTLAARARTADFRRPPRCPSRHRRALGPSQRRPRCRPSERRRCPRWRRDRLPPRHPADSPAPSNECPSGSVPDCVTVVPPDASVLGQEGGPGKRRLRHDEPVERIARPARAQGSRRHR